MIELRQVSKIYPSTHAGLAEVSLRIESGSWVTLLGPSGSGKTSLLKLIAGLEEKTGGTLNQTHTAFETSYVFQEPALLPWKTTLENIILPLTLRGLSRPDAVNRASSWLQKLKLTAFRDSMPDELSGGLKMRVSLARALVTEPKLLLLDEPFAALDEPIRIELGIELRNLFQQLRPTIVMVTHSITEGLWLGDRAVVLHGKPGKIIWDEAIALGESRPLSLRGDPEFLRKVATCFELLKEGS